MNKIYSLVIDTFRKGIEGEKGILPDLTDEEKSEFLKLIKEQSLSVFLYKVYGTSEYKKTYLTSKIFENYVFKIKNEITSILEAENIPFYFIKGVELKSIYKDSALRTMGDIDFVVFKEDFEKVHKLLALNGYKDDGDFAENHIGITKNNVLIELHHNLVPNQSYFSSYFSEEKVKTNLDYKNHVLNNEYNFGFLLVHYIKHLSSGEGIRGLGDFYLLLRDNHVDKNKVLEVVNELKLTEFFNKLLNLLYIIFNYDEIPFTKVDNQDELISFIFASGTHGKANDFSAIEYQYKNSKKTKIGFIFSRIFPSKNTMKVIYPILYKRIWLLPVCYLHRPLKLLFSRNGRDKGKKVLAGKANATSVYDMFSINSDMIDKQAK